MIISVAGLFLLGKRSMPTNFNLVVNNGEDALAQTHTSGDGTLVVADGSKFGNPTVTNPIRITCGTTIFNVIGRSTNTLTIGGVLEGTTDATYPSGTAVYANFTAGHLQAVHTAINSRLESIVTIASATDFGIAIIPAANGQAGNMLELRNTSGTPVSLFDGNGYGFIREFTFVIPGPLVIGNDKTTWINVTRNGKISKAFICAKTAPTGASLIIDILKSTDGGSTFTSIWNATPANRLTLGSGSKSATRTAFDVTSVAEGDILRIDVAQASGAANVTVQVLCLLRNN